jgi:hypothetical protein
MEQFFLGIENYLVYGYSLSLIASILIFKKLNSHAVSSIVMIFFEILTLLQNPLYDFILTLNVHSGRIVWYLSWLIVCLIPIFILDYLHKKMSLFKSASFKLVRISFIAIIFITFLDCLDRYTINHESTWFLILLMKYTVQVGIVSALFIGLFQSENIIESLPHAAHSRSVTWYQSLQDLPPLQRARELEKWEAFTKDLPTENSLSISSRPDNYRF